MTTLPGDPVPQSPTNRRPGDLGPVELLRWAWRQLTSMRTALVLLLLLALAAIPGSVIPQRGVDSLATSQWQEAHPRLTPLYEALGLFSVFDTPWFAAIYLLLMVSLVGCIVPRSRVYWRALRAVPPPAPRRLDRLPSATAFTTAATPEDVLARARSVLRERRYRLAPDLGEGGDAVAAEKGYLREAGNLLFHISVLVVLVGFGIGSLFGYQGGVIVLVGGGFSNGLTQYDDFDPGSLFDPDSMEPFLFTVDDFDIEWIDEGPARGMAQKFVSHLTWREARDAEAQEYDLRVNHPLKIGGTDVFLIGHGYAPVVTVRDGNGDVATSGPAVFLPSDSSFLSFGVVKAPDAQPTPIGLEGLFYPTYVKVNGDPVNVMGDLRNPTLSLEAYTGDLGLDDSTPQSVYVLDKSDATKVVKPDGSMFRVDLQIGQTVELPEGAGSVTFEGVQKWNRIQISRSPGKLVALAGVVLALIGMLLSLFIRPRRVWVRARAANGATSVEVAGLERTEGGDLGQVLTDIVAALRADDDRSDDWADDWTERERP
jgi:cytochrome c biogenesis protein